jgi:hypothetical protein
MFGSYFCKQTSHIKSPQACRDWCARKTNCRAVNWLGKGATEACKYFVKQPTTFFYKGRKRAVYVKDPVTCRYLHYRVTQGGLNLLDKHYFQRRFGTRVLLHYITIH